MALWYHAERRLRKGHYTGVTNLADGTPVEGLWSREGLDYDDSVVPGQIVAKILNLPKPTDRSAFGIAHVALRNMIREPHASLLFGTALMTVTSVGFPVLGGTPPPWKWPADVQISAGGSHALYIVTASVLDNLLR